jgi:hypothetical protein
MSLITRFDGTPTSSHVQEKEIRALALHAACSFYNTDTLGSNDQHQGRIDLVMFAARQFEDFITSGRIPSLDD